MKNKFEILSLKEETKLSPKELRKYYEEFREYAINRKLKNVTPGATTFAHNQKVKEKTNEIADKLTDKLEGCKVIKKYDGVKNIPDGPVIYAHTHQGLLDNFSWIPATPNHAIILHSKKTRFILKVAQLNTGLILVKKGKTKKAKKSQANAKLDMITLGLNEFSIAYFPEAAWCLSPNKLHLPMRYGLFDIARKAGIPVIPTVDEFTYDTSEPKEKITKIHTRFGTPIYTDIGDDLNKKLKDYQEQISTMRWDLIVEKGLFRRSEVNEIDYINYLKGNIRNLKLGGIDINEERETIFDSDNEFYKFNHLNDVSYDELLFKYGYGKLLETEEVRKLQRINKIHNI